MEWPSDSIEHTILQALGELGIANTKPRGQAFLLHNRQLVGRRIHFEGVEAVWLSAERRITFYGEHGEVMRVVNVDEGQERRAA